MSTKRNEVPPHNLDAEKALLGAYLLRPDKLDDPASRVDAAEFYSPVHAAIFNGIIAARDKDIIVDPATVSDIIVAHDARVEHEALSLALELLQDTPHAESAAYYAGIVREHAIRRNGMARAREVADLYQSGADPEAIRAALAAIPDPTNGPRRQRIAYRTLANVTPRAVEWLWPGRVPLGKLTLLAGDPGLGKSFLTIDIAARISVGRPWRDANGIAPPKGDVILLSAEDDPEDTIRPRLDDAGGDPRRVHVVDGIEASARRGERPRSFCLETDLSILESMLDDFPETRLIVIDPISAYGNGSTDTHKNADVRAQLAALEKLAQDRHVAILVVSHLNKSGAGKAVYRVSGSLAYTAAARIAWLLAQDRDDESRRLLVQVKNNLAPDPGGLAFRVVEGRVDWEPDTIDIRADDLVASDRRDDKYDDTTEGNEAEKFLRHQLSNGELESGEIRAAAESEGISEKVLRTARERICDTRREGFGKNSKSYWFLVDPANKAAGENSDLCPPHATHAQSCPVPSDGHKGHECGMSADDDAPFSTDPF